jgi:hypothetical protein
MIIVVYVIYRLPCILSDGYHNLPYYLHLNEVTVP